MKKTILVMLVMISFITGYSQSANFEKGMKKGMEMMKSAEANADIIATANFFERIADAEKDQWTPLYWAAYNYLRAGFTTKDDKDKQDEYYQKGIALMERADLLKPDNSEIITLLAYLKLMYISVNPMSRAASGTPKAMEMLAQAKKLDSNNPRPYLVEGQNIFYTPKFWGGGKERALPILEEAMKKYEAQNDAELTAKFLPTWSKGRCQMLIDECKKED